MLDLDDDVACADGVDAAAGDEDAIAGNDGNPMDGGLDVAGAEGLLEGIRRLFQAHDVLVVSFHSFGEFVFECLNCHGQTIGAITAKIKSKIQIPKTEGTLEAIP